MDWSDEAIKQLYTDIGARIRSARKLRGSTQSDLASAVKLKRSSVANMEAGRQHMLVHTLVLVAQSLDVPLEDLLPSTSELEKLARAPDSVLTELEGQPEATHDFVTAALRRATGGRTT